MSKSVFDIFMSNEMLGKTEKAEAKRESQAEAIRSYRDKKAQEILKLYTDHQADCSQCQGITRCSVGDLMFKWASDRIAGASGKK